MNVASLELCKELYELSGWDGTHIFYDAEEDPVESRAALLMHPTKNCPAYDLGYLIRKLPAETKMTKGENTYRFYIFDLAEHHIADIPEDALAKLAIELFKQGILTKGTEV